jgi:DNA-directed RNA polymerase subunit H
LKKLEVDKHQLVPKHILLTEREKEELLQKFGINLRQLPRISLEDAAIKETNPKIGDVVKIVRKSVTAGESEYYRVVVKV